MSFHKNLTGADVHIIHAFTYANAAARLAATGMVVGDKGKIALQSDNNTYYVLQNHSPVTWREITSLGGGGGALEWRPGTSNPAPVEDNEFNQKVWKFVAGDGQSLYALVQVPETYAVGAQLLLDLGFYSPSTSNNFQFSTIASLIRRDTDAAGSTANQRTSTPAALTNTAPANRLRGLTFELTDATGAINGVPLSPGDQVEVELSRSAVDSDTDDVRMRPDSTSVRFA